MSLPGREADEAGLLVEEGRGGSDSDSGEEQKHSDIEGQSKVGPEGHSGASRQEGVLEQIDPVGKGIRIDDPLQPRRQQLDRIQPTA